MAANLPPKEGYMKTEKHTLEPLLKEHDVAEATGLSVATVRRWRLVREGPPYIKINSSVRYRAGDLMAWLAARPMGGEQAGG